MKLFSLTVILMAFSTFNVKAAQVLTLKQSLQYALENSPVFDTSKRQLAVAELEKKSAFAKFLPSLDLSATHGLQDSSPRTTGPWGSELTLALTENLYDNGVSKTNYDISTLKRNQAELFFQERKNKMSLDIVKQYLDYSLSVKLLDIQDKQVKLVNKQYDLISKAYYQGLKTKNDYLRFKTQVSRYEIDLVNSRNAVDKSKQELQRLIGVDLNSSESIDFVPVSLEQVSDNAIERVKIEDHLQFKVAEIQKDINRLDADLIEKKERPEWLVSSGVSYGSSHYLSSGQSFTGNDVLSWNALLTVKYNFLDWGVRSNDSEIARAKNIISNNDLKSDLLILKSDMNQFFISVEQVRRNYALAKELLSLEKNNISFIEVEYRNGKIQYLDLIAGLNNLTDAQIKFYTASSEMQSIQYTSLYHQGKLFDELIK